MVPLRWVTTSLGESSLRPSAMSTSTVLFLVARSYFSSARGVWQAPSRLPSRSTVSPLQPLPSMKTSHLSVTGSYLIMSPGPAALTTKFEKKNAFWLATQVGPSFQLYFTRKPPQMSRRGPTFGASNGPAGQAAPTITAVSPVPPPSPLPTSNWTLVSATAPPPDASASGIPALPATGPLAPPAPPPVPPCPP